MLVAETGGASRRTSGVRATKDFGVERRSSLGPGTVELEARVAAAQVDPKGAGVSTRGEAVDRSKGRLVTERRAGSVSWLFEGRGTSALRHLVCSLWAAS